MEVYHGLSGSEVLRMASIQLDERHHVIASLSRVIEPRVLENDGEGASAAVEQDGVDGVGIPDFPLVNDPAGPGASEHDLDRFDRAVAGRRNPERELLVAAAVNGERRARRRPGAILLGAMVVAYAEAAQGRRLLFLQGVGDLARRQRATAGGSQGFRAANDRPDVEIGNRLACASVGAVRYVSKELAGGV